MDVAKIRENLSWLRGGEVELFADDVVWKVGRIREGSTSGKLLAPLRHPENVSWKREEVKRGGICERCRWLEVCRIEVNGQEWRRPYNEECGWCEPRRWEIPEVVI